MSALPTVTLRRFFYGPTCTLGWIALDTALIYTLEDAWQGNRVRLSCIPDGTYRCRPRRFNAGDGGKGYPAIEITGVPGRSLILFHRGNTAVDVTGCIVVGSELGTIAADLAVLKSAEAWSLFHGRYGHGDFDLVIEPLHPLDGAKL
jgi:hypothetical protein